MNLPNDSLEKVLVDIYQQFLEYDPLDLLSRIAALQLYPENADHIMRLDALSHIAACLHPEPNKTRISRHRINRICNFEPLGNSYIKSSEDPCDVPFTEAFTFFGGSYIVFPGIAQDVVFALKHLAAAIFLLPEFKKQNKPFVDEIYNLILPILILSDEIARRAGSERNIAPKYYPNDVYVPLDLNAKKAAVVFNDEDLTSMLFSHNLSIDNLNSFIQDLGELTIESYSLDNTPLHKRPIIRLGSQFVVSEPGILLASLRYQILLRAKEAELLKLLAGEYQASVRSTVDKGLNMFSLMPKPFPFPEPNDKLFLIDSLRTLDTDKALYVVLLVDDLSNYEGENIFEMNQREGIGELIEAHIGDVEEAIFTQTKGLNEIFILGLFGGVGRSSYIGFNFNSLRTDPAILFLSVEEFEILSLLYGNNPLLLYKFAVDLDRLRKKSKYWTFSNFDTFEVYRRHQFSFYLSDSRPAGFINFSPGTGKEIRLDALNKHDKHAVTYWKNSGVIEVYNLYNTKEIPIYSSLDPYNNIEWFVEIKPLSFWVILDKESFLKNINGVSGIIINPALFVDMITYWLWQFAPDFGKILTGAEFSSPLTILVRANPNENWREQDINMNLYPNPVEFQTDAEKLQIAVTFHPSFHGVITGATNKGELECMRGILSQVASILGHFGGKDLLRLFSDSIPSIINKHLGNPYKKKILALHIGTNPQFLPGNYSKFREVQDADRGLLLDELGEHLTGNLKLREGLISKESVADVLNESVSYYFLQLQSIVRTLSWDPLLEFLVSHHEAIVSEQAFRKITISTHIACFGDSKEMTRQIVEETPKLNDAALSCRFLIEYIATVPPSGVRPISQSVYDRLMALASEIVSRGQESDYAKYDLFDVQLSILPSGRLGFINQTEYKEALMSFMMPRSREEIDDASKNFDYWWRPQPNIIQKEKPKYVEEFDLAFREEFGFALTDLSKTISILSDVGADLDENLQLKVVEKKALIEKIKGETKWEDDIINTILEFLSLHPRNDFMEIPVGFQNSDVFPWRLSRGLSYMRRPLINVIKEDSEQYICWGTRHLFDSFSYILQMSTSGRLQTKHKSLSMKKWIGENHKKDGMEFNTKVADVTKYLPESIVRTQVKKFGSTRLESLGRGLGDIDVFLLLPKIKTIVLIECKNILIARTPFEMRSELDELFVDKENSVATITKHKRREKWIRDNLELVLSVHDISRKGMWKIEPLLVVSDELITPYFYQTVIPVYSFLRFREDYLPNLYNKLARK